MLPGNVAQAHDAPLTYTVTELAYPHPEGGTYLATEWHGINNRGTLVGFFGDEDGTPGLPAAVYRDGEFTGVSVPGSTYTTLNAVNDRETSVGFYFDEDFATHAFKAERDGTVTVLPDYPGGYADNQATGINNRKSIVGYSANPSADSVCHAWVYRNGEYQTYDKPGMPCTRLYSINDRNIALGSYSGPGIPNRPFTIDLNARVPVITDIVLPGVPGATSPSFSAFAKAINDKNQVVGFYFVDQISQNFILDLKRNEIELWGELADPVTWTGINNKGVLAGYSSSYQGYYATPSRKRRCR